jgi:hypothetical protein
VTDCLLAWLIQREVPREQVACKWLENNYGKIPHSISAEALEMVPPEIEEEANLILVKPASQKRQ